ncbi:helix-turn-helix domain-containing protein [Ruminococcus sp.]|jgi:DNA-binding Xre family transcriptional regulator|uniref:helix-turn-helix domain-containing protein n=1 Tax=Ruminococcus sp. TaxID=41978 RepID=UPI00205A9C4D|nr:MAG TPA: LAMBDA REPRESSOR (TRIPLE MUTANT)/DNA COMPLEX-DNA COMPLEX, DOUBLE HELIX, TRANSCRIPTION-DNA.1A [Caudoviricetes sp.]
MGIGAKLSEILKSQNSNPNELADKIGITSSTIYSIIKRDNMKVDISVLAKICKALNVKMEVFYDEYISDNKSSFQVPFTLTEHEKEVITAYRSKPEMQQAVDRLLGVEESKVVGQVFRAACNGKNPEYITLTDEQRKKLEEAPSTDEL